MLSPRDIHVGLHGVQACIFCLFEVVLYIYMKSDVKIYNFRFFEMAKTIVLV